jgi:pimeloyl-ACP methyl ester carboxylesterase
MSRRLAAPVLAAASLCAAAAVAATPAVAAPVRHLRPVKAPAGLAFYKAPAKALRGQAHGGVIWARRQTGPDVLPGAGKAELLLYRSIGVGGKAVGVSGSVTLPKGKAPAGGWPVVTYAHGTTGIADKCAPTRNPGTGAIAGYTSYVYPVLSAFLQQGYAIVRTDYEGLGTPGDHPYLIGRSEGRSVMDIVRAARKLEPSLSKRVIVAGHSQGGHAALWAASVARTWTPELQVAGTVAFAPASHLSEQAGLLRALKAPGGGLSALAMSILRGLDVGRVGVDVPAILTPAAAALYPQTQTQCQPELGAANSIGGLAPADLVRSDVDLAPLQQVIDKNDDPENLTLRTPVLVEQGSADGTVFPSFTSQLVEELKAKGAKVDFNTFEGVDHGGIVSAAQANALAWMHDRLAR